MAPTDQHISDEQRPSVSRRSSSPSDASISEESYEFADLAVADGFRPTDATNRPQAPPQTLLVPSSSHSRSPSPSPSHGSNTSCSRQQGSSEQQNSEESSSTTPAITLATDTNAAPIRSRPSSISKAHRPHESLSLRNDGSQTRDPMSQRPQLPTLATGMPLSGSNQGSEHGSEPSHPFAAYGSRPINNTGAAVGGTVPEGEYNGPRGPTHPYALYPQSTLPLDETGAQHIPVGFTGLGTSYQRQVGPGGEDTGDLVGPLGHMEELPPYTRYPEQAYVRGPVGQAQSSAATTATTATTTTPPSAATESNDSPAGLSPDPGASISPPETAHVPAGAGGLQLATRNPEYSSNSSTQEDLSIGRSARSAETTDSSRTDINTAARDFAEKLPMGKWQRRARRKALGVIPYWAICLLVLGIIVVGIVMGTVLGVLLTDDGSKKPDGDESGSIHGWQPSADVEYLTKLPPNLTPLAPGLYDLPALNYRAAPRSCIKDTTQSQAWSCDIALSYYSIEIGLIPNASQVRNYNIQLEAINGSKSTFVWGTQPPNIAEPLTLRLVNDTFEPSRGPAWWREITYDKIVWVSDAEFGNQINKRDDWTFSGQLKEGFDPTRFMSSNPGPDNGDKAWICTWPNVTMEIFIFPNQSTSGKPWSTTSLPIHPTATGATDPAETTKPAYDPTPAYPQVVKFLERRLFMDDDETAATCEQVLIINDGQDTETVMDDDGDPVTVTVTERMSSYEEMLERHERSRHPDPEDREDRRRREVESLLKRETIELTDCGCLWWSQ